MDPIPALTVTSPSPRCCPGSSACRDSDAWLALLALPLPSDVLRKALVRLPGSVIPHMLGPQLLADFLTHCLNRGGLTGMLALNGLFLLVGLELGPTPGRAPVMYSLLP